MDEQHPQQNPVIHDPGFLKRQAQRMLEEYVAAYGTPLEKTKRDALIDIALRMERNGPQGSTS